MTEEELYQKIQEWIQLDKKSWNIVTFFAYYLKKYEDKNGVRFRITKSKNGPLSSKEMRDFSKLFKKFAPEDYEELYGEEKAQAKELANIKIYNYINWMFDYKFRMPGSSPDGTQVFFSPSYINNFERMYAEHLIKNSKKDLFKDFIEVLNRSYSSFLDNNECSTQQDLLMVQTIWTQRGRKPGEIKEVIDLAIKMGVLNEA